MKRKTRIPLHPFLFAVYPTVSLLAHNIEEVRILEAFRVLLYSLLAAASVFLLIYWRLKNPAKTALITSLTLTLFFSYGHVYEILKQVRVFGVVIGRHRFQLVVWALLFVVGVWWITKRLKDTHIITNILNTIIIIALVFPTLQIISVQFKLIAAESDVKNASEREWELSLPDDSAPPDVYYIILDGYPRADVLRDFYEYDASPFLEQLESIGFYVAAKSRSNYSQTTLSLASSLNMDYLETLGDGVKPGSDSRSWLIPLIQHSEVRQAFEYLGYQLITFETGFSHTDIQDADLYITSNPTSLSSLIAFSSVNPFEAMLLRSTMVRALIDLNFVLPRVLQGIVKDPLRLHRQRILSILDGLERMTDVPGPKFVFVHLLFPHPPFILGPNGEPLGQIDTFTLAAGSTELEQGTYHQQYLDQVIYLNSRLVPIMQSIIEGSETPPLIVMQSDHGGLLTTDVDQMRIFNAYYLPGGGDDYLYSNISPVNSFRLILSHYFLGNYPLLEDLAYFSPFSNPYELTLITEE